MFLTLPHLPGRAVLHHERCQGRHANRRWVGKHDKYPTVVVQSCHHAFTQRTWGCCNRLESFQWLHKFGSISRAEDPIKTKFRAKGSDFHSIFPMSGGSHGWLADLAQTEYTASMDTQES